MNPFLLREALEKLARKVEVPVPQGVRAATDIGPGVSSVLRAEGEKHPWASEFNLGKFKSKPKGVRWQAQARQGVEKAVAEGAESIEPELKILRSKYRGAADDVANALEGLLENKPHLVRRVVPAAEVPRPGLLRRFAKGMGRAFERKGPMLAAAALGTGTVLGGMHLYKKLKERRDTVNDYEKMLAAHPSLKGEDPTEVEKRYKTLRRVAPVIAGDPFASGSVVKQWIEYPTVSAATLLDAAKVQQATAKGVDLTKLIPFGSLASGDIGD